MSHLSGCSRNLAGNFKRMSLTDLHSADWGRYFASFATFCQSTLPSNCDIPAAVRLLRPSHTKWCFFQDSQIQNNYDCLCFTRTCLNSTISSGLLQSWSISENCWLTCKEGSSISLGPHHGYGWMKLLSDNNNSDSLRVNNITKSDNNWPLSRAEGTCGYRQWFQ